MFDESKVACEICSRQLGTINTQHLSLHNMTLAEYEVLYPNSLTRSPEDRVRRSKKARELWTNPNSKLNSQERSNKTSEALRKSHADPNSGFNTQEYRDKKSKSVKKLYASPNCPYSTPEYKAKQAKAHSNPDYLANQSKKKKELYANPDSVYNTPEYKARQIESQNTPEFVARHSEIKRKQRANPNSIYNSPEYRAKQIEAQNTPEYLANHSKKARAAHRNPNSGYNTQAYKDKKSEEGLAHWRDSEFTENMKVARNIRPNKPEQLILDYLNENLPGEWIYTGDFSFFLGGKNPDFLNINGRKLLIELFGDYWHEGHNPQDRIDFFGELGFDTLVIWESELYSSPVDVMERIVKFTYSRLGNDRFIDKIRGLDKQIQPPNSMFVLLGHGSKGVKGCSDRNSQGNYSFYYS